MKTLKARINWLFLGLIGCAVLASGAFVAILLNHAYTESLTTRLSNEAEMIATTIPWKQLADKPSQLQKQAARYAQTLNVQVAFFDQTGLMLVQANPQKKVSNQQYGTTEIKQALRSKQMTNFTKRKGNVIYSVVPIQQNGAPVGAMRLSLDLKHIDYSLWQIWISLIGGLIIAYALAAFASARIAGRVTRPLEEMTQVARDITQKRYYRRVQMTGNDEVASLGGAINRMARHLQKQMNTIRQSERKLISVMETLESGLLIIEPSGGIGFANQSFASMYGVKTDDLTEMMYQDLIYPFDLRTFIQQCLRKEQKMSHEIHLHYPTEKFYEVHLSPIIEKKGLSIVVVVYDMTAIRHLEQMRKDFVANVSHELKTPITSIRGFSETLLDGALEDRETSQEFLQIIHDESIRLQRLIGDLLDLSKLESKKAKLTLESVSIEPMLQSVVKTIDDQLRAKDQSLSLEITKPFEVDVEVDSFRQILLNLLSNAITYTPTEGQITIGANKQSDYWELYVKDTGVGIPEADQARIFERFYRVDKDRSRDSGGTGLGLAIVKHLVELHQGQIHTESELGQGSVFRLVFPTKRQTEH